MPTFENGWICRECWCANRETDERCYRCHAVPERRVMPEPITFSTPDGKPNEERKKVSSLTGPPVAKTPEAAPAAYPAIPLSERLRTLVFVTRARAAIAALIAAFTRLVSFGRAVRSAPGAGARRMSQGVRDAKEGAGSRWRSVLAHRRFWLGAAWVVSAFSSALLFSVALNAPFAASVLVVASVAIFSGLTAAFTTMTSERQARGMTENSPAVDHAAERTHTFVPAPEPPAKAAEVVGSRSAR